MAYFIRGTGQAVTPLKHSMDIFHQYVIGNYFYTLMGGKNSGAPIILDSTTFKGKDSGDTGRYHFIPLFTGEGIEGQNASIIGNENTLDEYYMDLTIDQISQAFARKGKMTVKRAIWDFRDECSKRQLPEWFRKRLERDLALTLSGFNDGGAKYITGAAALTRDAVKGDHRCWRVDYSSNKYGIVEVTEANSDATSLGSALAATDTMNTSMLDELQCLAKTADPKYAMRPYKAKNGEEYYILVLHPKAAIDLRRDDRWEKRAIASMTGRGSLENDPIATGAIGVWEHIIVKEADKVVTHDVSGQTFKVARNLLLGAEAAVMAYGQTLDYTEERLDHNRILSIAADEIRGVRKITFDGCDLNVAQVPCAIN